MNSDCELVSIYMLAYNCKRYIAQAIEGIVSQKTNFKFKLIIHDDASDDGTSEIIKEYADKYSDIIYAILQKENQYSKGKALYTEFVKPHIKGKYVASCEGDDFWCNENKLQMQFDYMESHAECSLCTHNTNLLDLSTGKTKPFNNWNELHVLNDDDVFMNWYVHTSSYFYRSDTDRWKGKKYWFGDYVMLTWMYNKGEIVCLPEIMSTYRFNNSNGVMWSNKSAGTKTKIRKERDRVEYLKEYNEITNYRYQKIIQKKTDYTDFICERYTCDEIIDGPSDRNEKINAAKRVINNKYYGEFLKNKKGLSLLKNRLIYEGYKIYPLWLFIRKKLIDY